MRRNYSWEIGSAVTLLMLSATSAMAATHKSPRECNSELYSRLGAIEAAGETPAQFVHQCWWHAQPGQPTPIARRDPVVQQQTPVAEARPTSIVHRVSHRRVADAGRTERSKRRFARATRLARLRFARAAEQSRTTRHYDPRLGGWAVARSELVRRVRRERLAAVATTQKARDDRRATRAADGGDLRSAVASLGSSARPGERVWVRVVAAGEVHMQPAVAIGGLSEGAERASALNCWGQPVLFVGRAATHWSRSMVCDGKPAGANEWSARIYHGGPESARSR